MKPTTPEPPALPESVDGLDGAPVRIGDRVAYAVRQGDTAALRVGVVLAFQYADRPNYRGEWPPKLRVDTGGPRPTVIDSSLRRFVRIGS